MHVNLATGLDVRVVHGHVALQVNVRLEHDELLGQTLALLAQEVVGAEVVLQVVVVLVVSVLHVELVEADVALEVVLPQVLVQLRGGVEPREAEVAPRVAHEALVGVSLGVVLLEPVLREELELLEEHLLVLEADAAVLQLVHVQHVRLQGRHRGELLAALLAQRVAQLADALGVVLLEEEHGRGLVEHVRGPDVVAPVLERLEALVRALQADDARHVRLAHDAGRLPQELAQPQRADAAAARVVAHAHGVEARRVVDGVAAQHAGGGGLGHGGRRGRNVTSKVDVVARAPIEEWLTLWSRAYFYVRDMKRLSMGELM
ncbi:hypothetical protein ON010_g14100 [Phytophthora cinnamomi]|nr:hypothetical protein ON010_g14100 [Phytophthora cinnamomi]